ncbi:uncharacterized protein LOC135110553 [Scylla paramamosain]|uniref:uncharacterized protein LOC135110553 n=1 Tax=Scylla paramamosain TaxID=85552 RepID=UPI0030827FDC
MLRRVTEGLPSPPPMVAVAVVVMMVLQPAHATTTLLQRMTQDELVLSVLANQIAILKVMNESSSHCTCGVDALREQEMKALRAMNDTVMTKMRGLEERINSTVEAMAGQISVIQSMNGYVMTKMEEIENLMQETLHNNQEVSICIGHKELNGSTGILKAIVKGTAPYSCSWEVTLPEGTLPVFHWLHFSMLCSSCNCGSVTFWQEAFSLWEGVPLQEEDARPLSEYVPVAGPFCGMTTSTPPVSRMAVTSNKFRISFQTKKLLFYSEGGGFSLSYYAVPNA